MGSDVVSSFDISVLRKKACHDNGHNKHLKFNFLRGVCSKFQLLTWMCLYTMGIQIEARSLKICKHIHTLVLASKGNSVLLSTDSMRKAVLSGSFIFQKQE